MVLLEFVIQGGLHLAPEKVLLDGDFVSRPDAVNQHRDETGHKQLRRLIMVKAIVSDFSDVVLSSHRGLNSAEIIQDCLEKAKQALTQITQQNYLSEAKQRGRTHILKVGLAFCGKHFQIQAEREINPLHKFWASVTPPV